MSTWDRLPGVSAVDADTVAALARHWEVGWNTADIDVIMEPFADAVVFSSPFVSRLDGDRSGATIVGCDAVRQYVADSFTRAAGIRYTLDGAYAGTDGVVLLYTCHRPDGTHKPGADLMRLDARGKVVEWRCHYPFG